MAGRSPDLSVVIVTPDCYETIGRTMGHLRAQTARDRLEVLIVAPSIQELGLPDREPRDFFRISVVEVGNVRSIARAYAAGIRRATAPVVVLSEDHSFPEPGWAATLIERHREEWAVVGPVVGNANPDGLISWADFLLGYGTWLDPVPGGEVGHLPGHNSSYKRAILQSFDADLETWLEAECLLHWELAAGGHRLYLEPGAKTTHLNFGTFRPWIPYLVHAGRVFAGARARRWSLGRRLLYSGGAPLIPVVRLRRIRFELGRPGRPIELWPRVVPALLIGLIFDAVGQMLGYALGTGHADRRLSAFEFHRDRHVAGEAH
jgi:hypothetical protein